MSFRAERYARAFMLAVVIGLILTVAVTRWLSQQRVIEIHAAMPENGGWSIDGLTVEAGETLNLRLVSDDVLHGFAIGQDELYNLDLKPGQPVETSLVFDRPGKYVFYCTRWCGPNHWRMRGTIDVSGLDSEKSAQTPLYVSLGLNLDAEHRAGIVPKRIPSAPRGALIDVILPDAYLTPDIYQTHSPASIWQELRAEPIFVDLDDEQIWDLVAYIWSTHTTSEALAEGKELYAANCAACHGERGAGDGVMAAKLERPKQKDPNSHAEESHGNGMDGHNTVGPTDFTDAEHLLGASPAILHGKIMRGGMGTGMPYWGPIFSDEQIWSLVGYLWAFQFQFEE